MFKEEDQTKMNDASYEYLYKKYLEQIVRFIKYQSGLDIEASKDIAHDVFQILWEKHEDFYDENEKKMLSWLYEASKRKSLEYKRKTKKVIVDSDLASDLSADDFSAEYEDLIHIEGFGSVDEKYQNYLFEIKNELDQKECDMLTLIVEKQLDAKEAAAMLNISDVNFRVRWCRLRNKLRPIVKNLIEK